jgi:hypothetical protein
MKKEEEDKIWSRVPKGGPIPRLTGRLTVGRKKNSNSNFMKGYALRPFPRECLWSIVADD